jgi:hypothetical protein
VKILGILNPGLIETDNENPLEKMRWIATGALVFSFAGMIFCRCGEVSCGWMARPCGSKWGDKRVSPACYRVCFS